MPHFAVVCPPMHGHLHPMFSLARECVRRGHRVTALTLPTSAEKAQDAGLELVPFGTEAFPPGAVQTNVERLGTLSGPAALRFTLALMRRETQAQLDELPGLIRSLRVDGLLVDQVSFGGGTSADVAGVPFVTVCNALLIDEDPAVPPLFTHWSARSGWMARLRNRLGYRLQRYLAGDIRRDVNRFRARHGLRPHRVSTDWPSPLATVAQTPAAFDFPRQRLRDTFHYSGPFQDPTARAKVPFPWERLDGRPLVYASMGTLQNRVFATFRSIAEACARLDVQAVLALGGADPAALGPLTGDPVVARYAPQLDLLARAAATVTHAGLNTVLESLACGTPIVAIPITNDQPGVAARLEWTGAGQRILPKDLTADRLRDALHRVLNDPQYRMAASRMQREILHSGGAAGAAEIVERALTTGRPVARATSPPPPNPTPPGLSRW